MILFIGLALLFLDSTFASTENIIYDESVPLLAGVNVGHCGMDDQEFQLVAECLIDLAMYHDQKKGITKTRSEYARTCHIGCVAYTLAQCEQRRAQEMPFHAHDRKKRKVTIYNLAWPKTIHYTISTNFDASQIALIQQGLQLWQDNTCLTFVNGVPSNPGTTAGFLRFHKNDTGCWSFVGNLGRTQGQLVNLANGCYSLGTVMHEIGHALGMYHEQTRPDRDTYISINTANIQTAYVSQYSKQTSGLTHGVPYDYGSVMHYSVAGFSTGGETMTALGDYASYKGRMMGQRYKASYYDYMVINKKVCEGDNKVCSGASVSCQNGGHVNPTDCTKCKCVEGMAGDTCTQADIAASEPTCPSLQTVTNVNSGTETCVTNPTALTDKLQCNWYLQAPSGCTIDMNVKTTSPSFSVSSQAYFLPGGSNTYRQCKNWVELRQDVAKRGLRLCRNDPVTSTLTSASNVASISYVVNENRADTFRVCYKLTNVACMATDPCSGVTCGTNGACVSGVCQCTNGYSGTNCDVAPCDFKTNFFMAPSGLTGTVASAGTFEACWVSCHTTSTCKSFLWNEGANQCTTYTQQTTALLSSPNGYYSTRFCGCAQA